MDTFKGAEQVDTSFTENPAMIQAIKKIKTTVAKYRSQINGDTIFADGRPRSHSEGKCGLLRSGCPICKIEQSLKSLQSNFIVNFIEDENVLNMKKFDHIAYMGITQGQSGILGKTEQFLKTNFKIYPAHHGLYYGNNTVIEIGDDEEPGEASVKENDFMDLNFDSIDLKKQENGFLDSTKCSFIDKCMANQSPLVKIHYAPDDLLNRSECKTTLTACVPDTAPAPASAPAPAPHRDVMPHPPPQPRPSPPQHSICSCCFNEVCQERRYQYIKHYESVKGHDYRLFTKNCENFATFVKTGKSYTTQVESITNVLSTGFYNVLAIQFGVPPEYLYFFPFAQWVVENGGNILKILYPPCTYKEGGHKKTRKQRKKRTKRRKRRTKKRKKRHKKRTKHKRRK
jgi:hypothetical protein